MKPPKGHATQGWSEPVAATSLTTLSRRGIPSPMEGTTWLNMHHILTAGFPVRGEAFPVREEGPRDLSQLACLSVYGQPRRAKR